MLESDSHRVFINECLIKDTNAPGITKAELYSAYAEFCEIRGWIPLSRNRFGRIAPDAITQTFGLVVRGDIKGPDGKQNDGWKSLRLKGTNESEL